MSEQQPTETPAAGRHGEHLRQVPPLRVQILWLCGVVAALVVVLTIAGAIMGKSDDRHEQAHKTAIINQQDMTAQSTLEQEEQIVGRTGLRKGGPHAIAKRLQDAVPGYRVLVGTAKAATDTKTVVVGPGSTMKRYAFYLRSQSGAVWRVDGAPGKLISVARVG